MSEYALQSIRSELIEWSQPLIVDQINHFYFYRLTHTISVARDLSIQHYRVWRHVLRDEMQQATDLRAGLVETAERAGMTSAMLDEVDRAVLDELMDVVVCRFRRTPNIARSYGLTLLDTATSMARARHAVV